MAPFLATLGCLLMTAQPPAPDDAIFEDYWTAAQADEILDKTETIRLAPSLDHLAPGERAAVAELIEAGQVMQRLYESARHPQALLARSALYRLHSKKFDPARTEALLDLYRLFQGPIASTLDNRRVPFLPVDPQAPGRNVYPKGATREEIDGFLAAHPGARPSILGERTVVRRMTPGDLDADLKALSGGALGMLHARLAEQFKTLRENPQESAFYAVPYAVAYASELAHAFGQLNSAADHVEADDPEFARYLRNRARDLLSNDYESGDASWVTGRFKNLNAQIGAYETYDDALYGVKAFHSLSVLALDRPATDELRQRLGGLQAVEDALPYDRPKRVKEDISVGVYDVIADFGQARGTNTATILPNDALFSRRYGRTILLRRNIMTHPDLFAADLRVWKAATADAHAADLAPDGNFQRTLWHEVGHYLGVDRTRDGRPLDEALEDQADALEEMKSDLVSLFALQKMAGEGSVTPEALRSILASGIRRTLQNVKPRSDQPYQTMQLAQFNYFLDRGLIAADPETARLTIDYAKYPAVVADLLREVLALQDAGDRAAAVAFFAKWGDWTPEVHEKLAALIRDAQGARFRLVKYGAMGE
jgi:hypothetical protein